MIDIVDGLVQPILEFLVVKTHANGVLRSLVSNLGSEELQCNLRRIQEETRSEIN